MRWLFLCAGVLLTLVVFGQNDSKRSSFDTLYIKNMSNKLAIRFYGVNKYNRFGVSDFETEHEVDYQPNANFNLGIAVNYKWFGLGIAFNFPFVNNDNHIYGETTRFDLQTSIFTRRYVVDLYYHTYKGFYISNPKSYLEWWENGMPYPKRPDIRTNTIGGSFTYAFNYKKYSPRAAFIQTDLQKKSAGSFLLGGFAAKYSIRADSVIVPEILHDSIKADLLFQGAAITTGGVSAGYTHTFVMWKKLYISMTMAPGISFQNIQLSYPNREDKIGNFVAMRLLGRFAMVYNTEKSFFGFTTINDNFLGRTDYKKGGNWSYETGTFRIFYGRRF